MRVRSKKEILETMISNFNMDIPVYEGTITHAIFSSVANAIAREYSIKSEEEKQIFLVDGRSEFLDKRAGEFGYDRKDGEHASGSLVFVGTPGTLLKVGLLVKCNGLEFAISEGGEITSEGEGKATVKALLVGSAGNIRAGSDFTCEEMEFDRIFNENDFINGIDVESDEDFYSRFFYTQRHKGTTGNEEHYTEWAKSIDGVLDAKTTGLKNGHGTVEVVISGKKNVVDEDTIRRVKEYIETVRPIGPRVTVKSMSDYYVSISAKIRSKHDVNAVKSEYIEIANKYLGEVKENIVYSKLYSLIAGLSTVDDVVELKVNGGSQNLKITSEQKAKIESITIEVVV